jgi:ribosomal protein L37AE/L43A
MENENKNQAENINNDDGKLLLSDVIKCPFCGSYKISESMFIEEWDCYCCLKPFKKKDFL